MIGSELGNQSEIKEEVFADDKKSVLEEKGRFSRVRYKTDKAGEFARESRRKLKRR